MLGCPIRISADQFVCADPRGFSQLITSFFASESLGIPHTPLFSLLYFLLFYEFYQLISNRYGLSYRSRGTIARIIISCIFFQYVNERFPSRDRGEYRSRTDDLLRARQAL